MNDSAQEQSLLERIRRGDKAACAECATLHAPALRRLALRLTQDESEAEDVVQETFLNAFKAIARFEGRSELSTWLYRIAYNVALGRMRRRRFITVQVDEAAADHEGVITPPQLYDWCCLPDHDFKAQEARLELQRAIADLPDKLRDVFVLRELEDLSTQETADLLGLSPENVKTRLHRARLRLRDRLAGYFSELQV